MRVLRDAMKIIASHSYIRKRDFLANARQSEVASNSYKLPIT